MKSAAMTARGHEQRLRRIATSLSEHYHRYSSLTRINETRDARYARFGMAAWAILMMLGGIVELIFFGILLWQILRSIIH